MSENKWWWCLSCQKASQHPVRKCLFCESEDYLGIQPITEEWADKRLAALKEWRRVKEETIPGHRVPKCKTCGGVKLGKGAQKFLSSGRRKEASDDRWTGPARIIFSAGNVTGGATEEVKVCRCIQVRGVDKRRKRTYTLYPEVEGPMVKGEGTPAKPRPKPVVDLPEKREPIVLPRGTNWLLDRQVAELHWQLRRKGFRQ